MRKRKSGFAVGAALTIFFVTLHAAHGQAPLKPDASPHLSLVGFTLEKNTLVDVENKLGASPPGSCSSEIEASKEICFVTDGPDKTKVFFESGPSGGWSKLDGIRVASGNMTAACHLQCTLTPALGRDIHTPGGLKLELTRPQLIKLLGTPTKVAGNRLTFEWWSKRPMSKAEIDKATQTFNAPVTNPQWDVHDTILATFGGSKVTEFEVRRTVTY